MSIDLSGYSTIEAGLFVKITCDYYVANPGDTPTTEVLTFSDYIRPITIDGTTYQGLGRLLSITASTSEIKVSQQNVTIGISGIPNTSIAQIVNSRIKGSLVEIYRGIINTSTGLLDTSITGNPAGRFNGFITNYSLTEEFDIKARKALNTIVLTCASTVDVLANTASGRRTNPQDQKALYPNDLSMDRVPTLVGSNFNFGAPA